MGEHKNEERLENRTETEDRAIKNIMMETEKKNVKGVKDTGMNTRKRLQKTISFTGKRGKLKWVVEQVTESEFRALRKRAHVCRDCGKVDAYTLNGRTYCFECAEKSRLYKTEARADPERNEKLREAVRKVAEKRKEAGLCPRCGRKINDGHKTCEYCRAQFRNQKRIKRNRPKRGSYGICYQCNKEPAISGKRVCSKCYEMKMKCLGLVGWLGKGGNND